MALWLHPAYHAGRAMDLSPLIALGLLLGVRHALDADHIIAVSTILARERSVRRAVSIGMLWGLGHTLTILLIGGGIIALQIVVSPRAELLLELPVAAMLIFLGVRSIGASLPPRGHDHARAETPDAHRHVHTHGDYIHEHQHGHHAETHGHDAEKTPVARLDRWMGRAALYRSIRPLAVGTVHGLAGSAAIALLIVPIAGSSLTALLYLFLFGAGTIAGMTAVTAALSLPLSARGPVWTRWRTAATAGVGALSIGFGLYLGAQVIAALVQIPT